MPEKVISLFLIMLLVVSPLQVGFATANSSCLEMENTKHQKMKFVQTQKCCDKNCVSTHCVNSVISVLPSNKIIFLGYNIDKRSPIENKTFINYLHSAIYRPPKL